MKVLRIALFLLLLAAPAARAAAGAGGDPFQFLFIDAHARAVAMGGAYSALATDANALHYNPAGLAFAEYGEASFMHNRYFEDISQEYVGAAWRGWGASLNYLDFGSLPRTTVSEPFGTGGTTGMNALELSAGRGYSLSATWSAGAAAKFLRESIDNVSASGYAFDAGTMWQPEAVHGLSLAAVVQNLGPAVRFQTEHEKLPLNARLGGAYSRLVAGQKSAMSVDLTRQRAEPVRFAVGLETVISDRMPLRLGYNSRNDAGPGISIGLGWRFNAISVDYAFTPFGQLGSANRFSFTWRWGEPDVSRTKPEPSWTKPAVIRTKPDALQAKPSVIQAEPNAIQTKPDAIQSMLDEVQTKPDAIQTKPQTLKTKSKAVKKKSKTIKMKSKALKTRTR